MVPCLRLGLLCALILGRVSAYTISVDGQGGTSLLDSSRGDGPTRHATVHDDAGHPVRAHEAMVRQARDEPLRLSQNQPVHGDASHQARAQHPILREAGPGPLIFSGGPVEPQSEVLGEVALKARYENEVDAEKMGPSMNASALENSLQIATQAAAAANASYFLIYGSALGIYREHGVIDGDDDIDIAVPRDKLKDVKRAIKTMTNILDDKLQPMNKSLRVRKLGCSEHSGFTVKPKALRITFWGYTLSTSGEHVCFGPKSNGCRKFPWSPRDAYPKEMMLPPQLITIRSTKHLTYDKLPVPRAPAQYLELNYGEDFNTRKESHSLGAKGSKVSRRARYDAYCS